MLRNCVIGETELSVNSGPIVITTPGYPNAYTVSEECSNKITINSDILIRQISVVDRQSPGLNAYLCETLQMVEVHIQPGIKSCPRVSSIANYPQVASFTFIFQPSLNPIRGILFEVTAGEINIILQSST